MKQQIGAQRVKVITLGDVKVGKSCLVKKYCDPNHFVSNYVPTIGVDYGVKTIAHKGNGDDGSSLDGRMKIKVDFFDLSGDPDYNEVRNEFYANADGVLIIFDVTRKESFASLDGWLKEVAKYGLSSQSGTMAVVANKVDQYPREVTEQEVRQLLRGSVLPPFAPIAHEDFRAHHSR